MAAFMIGSGPSDGHELRVGSAEGCRQPQEAWCIVRGGADGLRRPSCAHLRRPGPFRNGRSRDHRGTFRATAASRHLLRRAGRESSDLQRAEGNTEGAEGL